LELSPNIKNKKILIIDDDPSMRSIITTIFSSLGFTGLDEAEDGVKGLKKLQAQHYDYVICDWTMPNMGGLELLNTVRKDDELKSVPFLMCTAITDVENVSTAIKSGVTDYISKPFAPDALYKKVIQALEKIP